MEIAMEIASDSISFNDLPKKALNLVFQRIDQPSRQKLRQVCHFWKSFIDEEFPIELVITQENYQRLFRCPNANKVEIQNLTTEYTGEVWFGPTLRSILFSGKVLTSNIFSILRYCPELQLLQFSALKQVLGIQGAESIKLPRTTMVEFKIRPDQETFTADEIITISVLRQILFGSLKTIMISTRTFLESWEEEEDDQPYDDDSAGSMRTYTVASLSPLSSAGFNADGLSVTGTGLPSMNLDPLHQVSIEEVNSSTTENIEEVPHPHGTNPTPVIEESTNDFGTQTTRTNLHVLINRGGNYTPGTASSHSSASSSGNRRIRYNVSEFEARLFLANLELLADSGPNRAEISILNGSLSQTRIPSSTYFEAPAAIASSAVKQTVFFELIKNNCATLKNLCVQTRSDFTCFGNLSGFSRDLPKVQLEELEYSFGRMQVCGEYGLLRAQTQLKKIRLQVFDDMWKHFIVAVTQCQGTLEDLDVKVLSMNEDRVDITSLMGCSNLKSLKLLHFFEKESACRFPTTLSRLIINGPISYRDMDTWASELLDLTEFTLLLNIRGDKIDLPLYKKFLKLPKLGKLTLIQCPMDLESIRGYIDSNIKSYDGQPQENTGFKFIVHGPREVRDAPFIQYVYTIIEPDKFNRDRIVVENDESEINASVDAPV